MSDKLYTIGKISALTNVSIDQLRNYDKIGLLKPEGRGSNNYRYYTENQLEDILVIKELKNIGIPLRMIGKFLENGDLETIQKTLEENLQIKRDEIYRLQKQYNDLVDALINVERAISHKKELTAGMENPPAEDKAAYSSGFEILSISERPIISLRRKSRCYKTNHYTERYMELQNLIEKTSIDAGRSWFIVYHDPYQCIFDWGEDAVGDMEFFSNVKHGYASENSHCRIFGGFQAACATYVGAYDSDKHQQIYEELTDWALSLGYHTAGISYQELVIGRNITSNPEDFITKIYLPLNVNSI